jgi:hypothetical protein
VRAFNQNQTKKTLTKAWTCAPTRLNAIVSPVADCKACCRYLKQTIDQSSPAQLTAMMKFLQPFDESTARSGSISSGASKPISPIADDKAEEVRACNPENMISVASRRGRGLS